MNLRTLAGLSLPLALQLAPACVGRAPDDCAPASEIPYDGVDQDCDGADLTDADGDGFDALEAGGNDCDDHDEGIFPNSAEIAYDGIDQDCDGADLTDVDRDGFDAVIVGGTDCDDDDPLVHLGVDDTPYDGIDQDCDGADLTDVDGDGHDAAIVGGDDCDDDDPTIFTGLAEVPYDGIDQDCDGADLTDVDGDGHDALVAGGDDCDDDVATTHPGAQEVCDALDADEDCNGFAEDDDPDATEKTAFFVDADGDGFGAGSATPWCDAPAGWSEVDTDCDDSDAAINPDATEVCDLLDTDEDCDGLADDLDPGVDLSTGTNYFVDFDGDGYGSATTARFCDLPAAGYSREGADCDDGNSGVNPGAVEICDDADVDEDCDGLVNDADDSVTGTTGWYVDADADGYGAGTATSVCSGPSGSVANAEDCDDGNAAVNPAATELCDADDIDEDCDGLADDADSSVDPSTFTTFYVDADADGYGSGDTALRCDPTAGFSTLGTDCDDTQAAVHPGAQEVCDPDWTDEDCDGLVDDDDPSATGQVAFYVDADGDGYGVGEAVSPLACHPTVGFAEVDGDCDDTDPNISPGATDTPNDGIDQDCSGVDLVDGDGDGFGSIETGGDDCDDTDATVYPGAPEDESNGIDDDCDGRTDETLVCWDGSGDFRTVQHGVDLTPDGGTIEICPGTYNEDVMITDRVLTIEGGGVEPADTSIEGAGYYSTLYLSGAGVDLTVRNLAISGPRGSIATSPDGAERVSLDLIDFCSIGGASYVQLWGDATGVSVTHSYFCARTDDTLIALTGEATFAENVVLSDPGRYAGVEGESGDLVMRNNLFVGGNQYLRVAPNTYFSSGVHLYNNTFADGESFTVSGYSFEGNPWSSFTFHDNLVSGMTDPASYVFDISYYAGRTTTPSCSGWLPAPFSANIGYTVSEGWLSCEAFCWEDDSCSETHYYSTSQAPLFQAGFTDVDPMFTSSPGQGDYALAPGSPAIDAGFGHDDADGTPCDIGAFGGSRSDWWQEVPWLD